MATKDIETILPLTPLQQGLLFHAVEEREADPYVMQHGFVLEGALDPLLFERAFQHVVQRHAILRTCFIWEKVEAPVQVVRASVQVPCAVHDYRDRGEAEQAAALTDWFQADRQRGFDLRRAPLMRLTLLRVAERRWYIVNTHHHLLLDGWSFALVLNEALVGYRSYAEGRAPALPEPVPFRSYIAWLKRQAARDADGHFREVLAGFRSATPLPLAQAGALNTERALPCAEQELALSVQETAQVEALARSQRVTLNTLIQAAYGLLLQRHAATDDVVFGATVSGRPPELPGAEELVGVLINTLPIRLRTDGGARVARMLQDLQAQNSELRQFEWTPLAQVQKLSEVPAGSPLFESIVVFDSYPEADTSRLPADVRVLPLTWAAPREDGARLSAGRNSYALSLIVEPSEALRFVLCYRRARLSHDAAASLLAQLRTLLLSMVAHPEARVGELALVGDAQRAELRGWSTGEITARAPCCVHELFEAAAREHPERVALVCEETRLTYAELDARAERLAQQLVALGVGPEVRVGLCTARSAELVVGLLAAWKAGGAYVPLDPKLPRARLAAVFADSGARVVLTDAPCSGLLEGLGLTLVPVDRASALAAPLGQRVRRVRPEHLAYLIYTSGSTGRPKGVAVEHRQLATYVRGVLARLGLPAASFAHVSTTAADLGHTSLFGALCSGGTLHLLSDERIFHPGEFAAYVSHHQVEVLKIVPSHLAALLDAPDPASVLPRRCLVLGGEALPEALVERVRSLAPELTIINHYGPTETTVGCLTQRVEGTERVIPIGRPLPNTQAHILDHALRLLPLGAVGELYIGGAGVARGYQGRPALTAAHFVPDPFSASASARLYRTGDRARRREDGAIEFLGRGDHQIKLRGFRIELGDIEAQLRAQPGVAEAVVVLREEGEQKVLAAYVVARTHAALEPTALSQALRQRLPEYMVPGAIMVLPALPLTTNGKIDRARLPRPGAALARAAFVAPRNPVEETLAQIWREVLKREQIGVHDNFFELGGDSILSLQIVGRAHKAGLRLTPKQLFTQRTIANLSAILAASPSAGSSASMTRSCEAPPPFSLSKLEPARLEALKERLGEQLEDVFPATPVQQGMLFHALLSPETSPYFNQIVCRFEQGLEVAAFERAFESLSHRHAILRTGFITSEGVEPHQIVLRKASLPLTFIDHRALSCEQQRAARERYLRTDRARAFDFDGAVPLMRVAIMRQSELAYEVVWSVHHAVLDGWCQARLIQEWIEAYGALRAGAPLAEAATRPYRDFVAWLARRDRGEAKQFFRTLLAGCSDPTRLPPPVQPPAQAALYREHKLHLSAERTAVLLDSARGANCTLNTLVQAAWAWVLGRHTGRDDVLFGITVAGRPAELDGSDAIMGTFINSLPIRLRLRPEQPVADWLAEVQALNLELREYEHTPLVELQALGERGPSGTLFEALLVFQNYPFDDTIHAHRRALGIEVEAEEAFTHYPLTLYVVPGRELVFSFSYDAARVDEASLLRMAGTLESTLISMAAQLQRPLGLLPPSDAQPALPAPQPLADGADVLSMIAAQVERSPDAIAAVAGAQRLTYLGLEVRANQLAHTLRARGVGPGSLVGVCTSRSLSMLAALLAVWKCGAAYVPLDPAYPAERIEHMVEDSGLTLILTEQSLLPRLPDTRVARLCLEHLSSEAERSPPRWRRRPLHPESLAYVIYTSGSTGKPKGVMVRHAGVQSFLTAVRERLACQSELTLLATTSLSFDIAVLELFLPLLVGGRVVLAAREEVVDHERLLTLLHTSRANAMQATPTGWKALLASAAELPDELTVLCGGEALSPELAEAFMQRGLRAYNLYGPTEATVWSTVHELSLETRSVPLGVPLSNTSLYVLDRHLQPTPPGVVGEIYLGGHGVARGYAGRTALTAQRFLPDPFSRELGQRMYRTGDLARFAPDGTLEYLGRVDQQVKVRGHRIELGEIESALRAQRELRETVVVAREQGGIPQLVAYVVPAQGAALDTQALRAALQRSLPDYMLPQAYVVLEAIPLTPNGKLDRRALPEPGIVARPRASAHPRTDVEELVTNLFAEVLGMQAVAPHESFFELGGHSLLATQLVARVRRTFAVELPLRSLFEQPTPRQLSAEVERLRQSSGDEEPALVPVPRTGALPLSFAQQRLWLAAQIERDSAAYNMTAAVRLEGALDLAQLQTSFRALVERHESLRTSFGVVDGEPVQTIAAHAEFALERIDLSQRPRAEQPALVQEIASAAAARPFDLARAPLLRVTVVGLAPEEHVVVLGLHHIVGDGWSMNVLVAELAEIYDAQRSGRAAALSPLPVQYADFALWQRAWLAGPQREAQLGYWRDRLRDAALLELPTDRPRALNVGSRGGRFVLEIDRTLTDALRRLGRREGATLFMTLFALYNVLLFRRTGRTDLLVGTDVANRRRAETEGLIGFFVNLLALRTELSGGMSVRELLRKVRESTLDAYAHQDLPFEQVVEAVRVERDGARQPLVQTLFVLQNQPARHIELADLRLSGFELDREVARFDLGVFAEESDEGITLAFRYRAELFEPSTIARWAAELLALVKAAVENPEVRLSQLAAESSSTSSAVERARDRLKHLKQLKPARVVAAAQTLTKKRVFGTEPLPLVIEPAVADLDLAEWARSERASLQQELVEHGAILFRGFGLVSVAEFEQVAQAVCGELFGEYGDLPREKSGRQVYGSTPYPADKTILFHNESSHLPRWPLKQWFFCTQAAPEGGATPIVDCRRLYQALPAELRQRFERLGLMYVRNFTPNFDVGWQDFFRTREPAVVEQRCNAEGMHCEWFGERLRVTQRGPAVLRHPVSGQHVFFNQVQLHHPAYLDANVRESLLAMLGEDWLPRNVRYGDGSHIDRATTDALAELYARYAVRFSWQPGDLLLLDNMLVAHGRDPFSGPRKIVVAMGEMKTRDELERPEA